MQIEKRIKMATIYNNYISYEDIALFEKVKNSKYKWLSEKDKRILYFGDGIDFQKDDIGTLTFVGRDMRLRFIDLLGIKLNRFYKT